MLLAHCATSPDWQRLALEMYASFLRTVRVSGVNLAFRECVDFLSDRGKTGEADRFQR